MTLEEIKNKYPGYVALVSDGNAGKILDSWLKNKTILIESIKDMRTFVEARDFTNEIKQNIDKITRENLVEMIEEQYEIMNDALKKSEMKISGVNRVYHSFDATKALHVEVSKDLESDIPKLNFKFEVDEIKPNNVQLKPLAYNDLDVAIRYTDEMHTMVKAFNNLGEIYGKLADDMQSVLNDVNKDLEENSYARKALNVLIATQRDGARLITTLASTYGMGEIMKFESFLSAWADAS